MGYTENINSILKWGNSFQRQFDFPLDRSSLHGSYEDAVAYAKGDASDERALGGQAYIGQIITVWGLNEKGKEGVWVYSLVPSTKEGYLADLKPVGAGSATETADTYSAALELSNDLVVGQLILVSGEETVGEQTYKSGFYIVNAPGTISALDTSTGASDEIGALSNRVAAVEGKVTELEGNRVLNTDFEAYKSEVATALDGVNTALGTKVASDDFEAYKSEVATAFGGVDTSLATKVSNDAFDEYKEEVSGDFEKVNTALGTKVASDDFETYKSGIATTLEGVNTALDTKVESEAFTAYQGEVDAALGTKVETEAFTAYQGEVTAAIGGVNTALDAKADASALNTLEEKVDVDIQNLTSHLVDYANTLGDVDDRLGELETFVTVHVDHDRILDTDIEGLFTEQPQE